MSVDLVSAAFWLPLEPIRKFVLVALCERANLQTGYCWPGRDEIAARVSLSPRRVTPHLQALEADDYLRSRRRGGPHEGHTTQRWLNVDRILREGEAAREAFRTAQKERDGSSPNPYQLPLEGDDDDPTMGRLGQKNGTFGTKEWDVPRTDRTVKEPSIEPSNTEDDARARDRLTADFAAFGAVHAGTVRAIDYAVEDYGLDLCQRAVRAAAGSALGGGDHPPWSFVEKILERWRRQGGPDDERSADDGKPATAARRTPRRASASEVAKRRLAAPG